MFKDALALKHMKVGQTGMREYANNLQEQMKQQPMQMQQPQPQPEPLKPPVMGG